MSFFPLRKPMGCVWPAVPSSEPARIWAAYRELERTQWQSPAEIESGQLSQLRALLTHAEERIPYYSRLLDRLGIVPHKLRSLAEFRKLPLLQRQTYQENLEDCTAKALPEGMTATGKIFTSGSTGVPVEVRQTNVVNLMWFAFYLRDAEWSGFDHRGSIAVIRTTGWSGEKFQRGLQGVVQPCWNPGLAALIDTGPCFQMDIHQEVRAQLAWLQRIQPDYMLNFPSNLDYLARLLEEDSRPIKSLKAIQTVAEQLTPDMKARIEKVFGVPVKNTYSCSEAGYLASPCPSGVGFHVHAENVLLEVLDADGNPCGPGQTGRVVLTTLHNFRAPLIRYEIRDEATVGHGRCPCGRGLPWLERIEGRVRPMFVLPGGVRRYSSPLIIGLEKMEVTYQYQIVQKAEDRMLIRTVPNKRWSDGTPKKIDELVQTFFNAPIRVEVECLDKIPLPPGGKHKVALCEVP